MSQQPASTPAIITDETTPLPGGLGEGNWYVRGPVFGLYVELSHDEELETSVAALTLAGKLRALADDLATAAGRLA